MPRFLAPLDLTNNELRNAVVQNLAVPPATPANGNVYYDTSLDALRYYNGTWVSVTEAAAPTAYGANTILKADVDDSPEPLTVDLDTILGRVTGVNSDEISALTVSEVRTFLGSLDQLVTAAADVSLGGNLLTDLATPVSNTDAANKLYVDSAITGLDLKESARAAADTDVDLAAPGATLDGVTLNLGDRVLLMGQTDATENGLYLFNGAAAALTRAPDADAADEVNAGLFAFVSEGTANGNRGYVLVGPDPITLGTTDLNFTQFSGSGSVIGTANRIQVTGNQVDIDPAYKGQASIDTVGTVTTGTWHGNPIAIAYGGTGATDMDSARVALGAVGRFSATVGGATSMPVVHNLGTKNVDVVVRESATDLCVDVDWTATDNNTVTVNVGNAPAAGALTVAVFG